MDNSKVLDTPETIEYKIPVKRYWIPMFLNGTCAIFYSLICIFIVIKLLDGFSFGLTYEMGFHFILTPIFINLGMWFNFGFEKIIFINQRIEIIKSNKIFSTKKIIDLCEIEAVSFKNENPNVLKGVIYIREMKRSIFWWKMGELILKTKNSDITILNGLRGKRKIEIKKILETEIEKRCSK